MFPMHKLRAVYSSSLFLVLLLAVIVCAIYLPGIQGPYIADDYPNIIYNEGIQINQLSYDELLSAATANFSGLLTRPISSLSFGLNYYFSNQSFNPTQFKLTNIFIHIVNSILLFFVARVLFQHLLQNVKKPTRLAFLTALIWAIHPIQLTSVLYVVQRMTSLSGLFVLAGFLLFLQGRVRLKDTGSIRGMIIGCTLGTFLGALCKENALLLPFLLLATEISLFQRDLLDVRTKRKLHFFYLATIAIPFILGCAYLYQNPGIIFDGYQSRDFNLTERLMTEARALWYYIGLIIFPDNHQLGLSHDDYVISRSLTQPITTILSIIGLASVLTLSLLKIKNKKHSIFGFAVIWFLVAHSMESTIFPLELIYEHRNYIASIGIVIGLVYFIHSLSVKTDHKQSIPLLYIVIIVGFTIATSSRAFVWSDSLSLVDYETRNHPLSVRAHIMAAFVMQQNNMPVDLIYEEYRIATTLDQYDVSSLIYMIKLATALEYRLKESAKNTNNLPVSFNSHLVMEPSYINSLNELIHQEITHRLARKTDPISTTNAIEVVVQCIIERNPECQPLILKTHSWIKKIIAKKTFRNFSAAYLYSAKIYAYQGNINQAYHQLENAINFSPKNMAYHLEKATLQITLSDWKGASATIKLASERFTSASNKKQLARIRNNLEEIKRDRTNK